MIECKRWEDPEEAQAYVKEMGFAHNDSVFGMNPCYICEHFYECNHD